MDGSGNLHMKMDRPWEARHDFETAVEIDPKFSQAIANLGNDINEMQFLFIRPETHSGPDIH